MADCIVLVGMPGSGKSTVGPALAQLMQWGFVDTDQLVAAEAGDVAQFIDARGIDAFRAAETDAITNLAGITDTVVAVGGGAVLSPLNRAALDDLGVVVWLRATVETLLERVGDGTGRPLLAHGPGAALRELLAERAPIYDDIADVVVDVDGLDENQVAVEVVKAVCE